MTPQRNRHEASIELGKRALEAVFPRDGYWVRAQSGLVLPNEERGPVDKRRASPEPDLVVVQGDPRTFANRDDPWQKPTASEALLVIEVSDSTLTADRTDKAARYAAAGVRDYWIVNLRDDVLEVRRRPRRGVYASSKTLESGVTVSALAAHGSRFEVSDFLP